MRKVLPFFLIIFFLMSFSCQKASKDKKKLESTENIQSEDSIKMTKSPLLSYSEGKVDPEMVYIEGGEFVMGDESIKTNQPHPVKLSSFYMAKYMITNGEWKTFLEDTGLEFTWDWEGQGGYGPFYNIVPTDDCPAQGFNWYYAIVFCNWASLKDGFEPVYIIDKLPREFEEIKVEWDKDAKGYRLPTDAEWEYAAKGGQISEGYIYPGSNEPSEIGRFGVGYKNSYPIGQFKPNELGLYDMGGDACEWCWDWYDRIMFEWLPIENPSVDYLTDVKQKSIYGNDKRILRGAHWDSAPKKIVSRNAYPPIDISRGGIRLVRNAE